MNEAYREAAAQLEKDIRYLAKAAGLKPGATMVLGCSTSEVVGHNVGSWSTPEVANAIFEGLNSVFAPMGVYIAAQCCEHLNRALIIEQEAAEKFNLEAVNVMPQVKAGGSFATVVWQNMQHPVAVEHIKAAAGLDIGNTLIGMHLKEVAVPVRLSVSKIGKAPIVCARTRPKFIGGERAHYNPDLK